MFDCDAGRRGKPGTDCAPGASEPGIPVGPPPRPMSGERLAPLRRGCVAALLRRRGAREEREAAVIVAVNRSTRRRRRRFDADPQAEWLRLPADRRPTRPINLPVGLDPESNHTRGLAGRVGRLEGASSYAGDLHKSLEEPGFRREVGDADRIGAVAGRSGERCGLFDGDAATGSLPGDRLLPPDAPAVLEVRVDREGDDPGLRAEAVGDIKGIYCYLAEESDAGGPGPRPAREMSNVGRLVGPRPPRRIAIRAGRAAWRSSVGSPVPRSSAGSPDGRSGSRASSRGRRRRAARPPRDPACARRAVGGQ